MPATNFIGASYLMRNRQFDCQRSVNLYPVKSESGTSKTVSGLQGTPGLKTFITFPTFPIRNDGININGRVFFVSGNRLYETFIDQTYLERGQLETATGMISMATNGFQLCIVDGANGYIFTMADNTFQRITDPYFMGSDTVDFIDSYFMFHKPDSQIYYISAQYDGLIGDPLDFASAEGSPDNIVAIKTVHQQVWLFGDSTVQIVYNSGAADFPFSIVQGSMIEYGCAAPASIVNTANTVFWLGKDSEGSGTVWMANGYQPQRISTHAIEWAIQRYGTISDAVGHTYQEDGHYFYVLNFPTAKATLVYDVALDLWHERAYFSNGEYGRSRANCHVFAYGKHLVGDYELGVIYDQSLNYPDDDGQEIRRMRTSPHNSDSLGNLNRIMFSSFQLDMQVGIGLDGTNDGMITPEEDRNPMVMLQWSDDGGMTWSSESWVSAGRIGEYVTQVVWKRLGSSRDRVWKVTFTGRCNTFWMGANVQAQLANA